MQSVDNKPLLWLPGLLFGCVLAGCSGSDSADCGGYAGANGVAAPDITLNLSFDAAVAVNFGDVECSLGAFPAGCYDDPMEDAGCPALPEPRAANFRTRAVCPAAAGARPGSGPDPVSGCDGTTTAALPRVMGCHAGRVPQ